MVRATLPPNYSLKTININVNHHLSYHFYWITVPTCHTLSFARNTTNELITFGRSKLKIYSHFFLLFLFSRFQWFQTKPEVIFLKWDARTLYSSTTMRISIKNNFHHISHCAGCAHLIITTMYDIWVNTLGSVHWGSVLLHGYKNRSIELCFATRQPSNCSWVNVKQFNFYQKSPHSKHFESF